MPSIMKLCISGINIFFVKQLKVKIKIGNDLICTVDLWYQMRHQKDACHYGTASPFNKKLGCF